MMPFKLDDTGFIKPKRYQHQNFLTIEEINKSLSLSNESLFITLYGTLTMSLTSTANEVEKVHCKSKSPSHSFKHTLCRFTSETLIVALT